MTCCRVFGAVILDERARPYYEHRLAAWARDPSGLLRAAATKPSSRRSS